MCKGPYEKAMLHNHALAVKGNGAYIAPFLFTDWEKVPWSHNVEK